MALYMWDMVNFMVGLKDSLSYPKNIDMNVKVLSYHFDHEYYCQKIIIQKNISKSDW